MVIVHKKQVAIPLNEITSGACFFDEAGCLYMATDEYDDVTGTRTVVRLETGRLSGKSGDDLAIPVKLTSVEVE